MVSRSGFIFKIILYVDENDLVERGDFMMQKRGRRIAGQPKKTWHVLTSRGLSHTKMPSLSV